MKNKLAFLLLAFFYQHSCHATLHVLCKFFNAQDQNNNTGVKVAMIPVEHNSNEKTVGTLMRFLSLTSLPDAPYDLAQKDVDKLDGFLDISCQPCCYSPDANDVLANGNNLENSLESLDEDLTCEECFDYKNRSNEQINQMIRGRDGFDSFIRESQPHLNKVKGILKAYYNLPTE